jgi:tRNA modification GTPase
MLARHQDPIVAVATASGRAGVGIVRASGRDLAPLVQGLCGRALAPRHATYLPFADAQGGTIDRGLAIHFVAPHSYTGEDVLELQAHGGPVVLQLLLARCLEAGAGIGLRLAGPGEFTQRAYLNGKLDLAQAEAVSDLIEASTEAAARSAGRSLAGAFSAEVNQLRDRLIALRMLVEATLDFPEEEIDFLQQSDARARLTAAREGVATLLERARSGALLREGMRVVLAGQPNVGKSSLLNALAGAELAIVTPIAGTTRDKISQTIQIEGVPVHVTDTAGLRELADGPAPGGEGDAQAIERIGIQRSWEEIAQADAVLFLHDVTRLHERAYQQADTAIAQRLAEVLPDPGRLLQVFNKADLAPAPQAGLALSAKTGEGLAELRQQLLQRAGWSAQPEGLFIARTRHVHALRRTAAHLTQAALHADAGDTRLELLAEELRLAHDALGEITGVFTSDELLGEIFGRFCIGK